MVMVMMLLTMVMMMMMTTMVMMMLLMANLILLRQTVLKTGFNWIVREYCESRLSQTTHLGHVLSSLLTLPAPDVHLVHLILIMK